LGKNIFQTLNIGPNSVADIGRSFAAAYSFRGEISFLRDDTEQKNGEEPNVSLRQGDPIGRCFAHWAAVYFFEYRISPLFGPLFSFGKLYVLISAKKVWATNWAIFSQKHPVTLLYVDNADRIRIADTRKKSN
jgi:hypothetical protein